MNKTKQKEVTIIIINERTVKYLAIYVSVKSRARNRIRVTDIESLNAIIAMRKMQEDLGIDDYQLVLVPTQGNVMFDESELLAFYVFDLEREESVGEVYLIDARALPEKLYVETCADGLVSMDTALVAYPNAEHYDRYAAISITNENPVFRITGVI